MPEKLNEVLEFLLTRRSRPAKTLKEPIPSREDIRQILTAASRSPDHGKLEPWRFIVLSEPSLRKLSRDVLEHAKRLGLDKEKTLKARKQYDDGKLAIAVIEVQKKSEKIPMIEQTYSAGAVCLALLNAALASGWGANWLTGWPVHDRKFVSDSLGLSNNERVAGMIYIGTETLIPPERPRPELNEKITWR